MEKTKKQWYQSKKGIVAILFLLPLFVTVGFFYLLIKTSRWIWRKEWSLPKRAGAITGMWGLILLGFITSNAQPATLSATTHAVPTPALQDIRNYPAIITNTPSFVTETPSPSLTPTLTPTVYIAPTKAVILPTNLPTDPPTANGLSNNDYYTNSQGNEVHSPAYSTDDSIPAGATAKCIDGTYSFSQSHRGTCSHHGGVASWL